MSDVERLARSLVEVPSHEDEAEVGTVLEEWLRAQTDATVERDAVGNVFAWRGSGEQTLALVGHHDVVPPADSQVAPDGSMVVSVDDGRLFGRGAADMKGAVAAMAVAFRDADPTCRLAFASFVGEESGGIGARHAVENGFIPEYAIVGEGSAGYATPGIVDVVVAHRGRRGSTLIADGEAAHASEPEAGVNAVYRAVDAIGALRTVSRPEREVAGEILQGTLEVTGIEAGTAMNVIPDRCTITLDERTLPGDRVDIEGAIEHLAGIEWKIDQDLPPMACSDDGFAATVVEQFSAVQEGDASSTTKPHATDASWLSSAGTATVVAGPAEQGEAHTDDESVSLELLETVERGYRACAETVGAGSL